MFNKAEIMSRAHDIREIHKTTFSVALAQSWREAKELRQKMEQVRIQDKKQAQQDVFNVLRGKPLELV